MKSSQPAAPTTARSTVGALQDIGDPGALVERLAAVDVALGGDEDPRLDLAEAIEHPLDAEVGRAGRPHRTHRRRAQHRDDRLGHVGKIGGHAIAGADARRAERRGERRGLVAQLAPRDRPQAPAFRFADDGRSVSIALEDVLREVQRRIRKETRPAWSMSTATRSRGHRGCRRTPTRPPRTRAASSRSTRRVRRTVCPARTGSGSRARCDRVRVSTAAHSSDSFPL